MGPSSQGRNATAKSASTGRSSNGLRAIARWTVSTTGTGSPPAVAWTLPRGNIVLPRTVVRPCIAHLTGLAQDADGRVAFSIRHRGRPREPARTGLLATAGRVAAPGHIAREFGIMELPSAIGWRTAD